ncbi:helix-turn-helix domain-containing protein [Cohnella fermenti]|uniref:helix-turn-helix domain-containing protein n=1 Tax=Cohnella fermenti TaxID=2565925 RepID=UPI0038B40D60
MRTDDRDNRKTAELPAELREPHAKWLKKEIASCTGERRRRIEGERYAETLFVINVWWPAFGRLEGLQPEFEVRDFRDGWRYLDFAFITRGMKVCIEIDPFGTHWRNIDRKQYSDNLMRQNHLVIDGWLVLRFSLDDIVDKPRTCQQLLQQLLGKWSAAASSESASQPKLGATERAILLLAEQHAEPLRVKSVAEELGIHRGTAQQYLRLLVTKGFLEPTRSDAKRVHGYLLKK